MYIYIHRYIHTLLVATNTDTFIHTHTKKHTRYQHTCSCTHVGVYARDVYEWMSVYMWCIEINVRKHVSVTDCLPTYTHVYIHAQIHKHRWHKPKYLCTHYMCVMFMHTHVCMYIYVIEMKGFVSTSSCRPAAHIYIHTFDARTRTYVLVMYIYVYMSCMYIYINIPTYMSV